MIGHEDSLEAAGKTPWEAIPGLDDPPDPIDNLKRKTSVEQFTEALRKAGYNVSPSGKTVTRTADVIPEDLSGVRFMVEVVLPSTWRRKYFKGKTVVRIWTRKKGWLDVAWFVSPLWARQFAHDLGEDMQNQLELGNDAFG